MKKIILAAAILSITLASCGTDNDKTYEELQQIDKGTPPPTNGIDKGTPPPKNG